MLKQKTKLMKKELKKKALIKCPECSKTYASEEIKLVEEVHPSNPHLTARYFNCPHCRHVTTVGIDDEEQIHRTKVFQEKTETFRKLVNHKANSSLLKSKQAELTSMEKKLSERRAELMEKYPL